MQEYPVLLKKFPVRTYLLSAAFLLLIANALMWAVSIPYNAAPDESTHFSTPLYIYQHGRLPVFGRDEETTFDRLQHVSSTRSQQVRLVQGTQVTYNSMPYIGYIISAASMKLLSRFDPRYLTLYARVTSILFYALFIYITWLLAGKLFRNHPVLRYLFPWCIATIPQVTFLAAYTNNDMLSLAFSALVIYCWLVLYDGRTTLPSPILCGAAVGLLFYAKQNYYILFPLTFAIYCFKSVQITKRIPLAAGWLLKVFATAVALTGFFIIRNTYLYGDPVGFEIFQSLVRQLFDPPFDVQKVSFLQSVVLFFPSWFVISFKTSLAAFDWLTLYPPDGIFAVIAVVSVVAVFGFFGFAWRSRFWCESSDKLMLYVSLLLLLPFSMLASLWNSYMVNFQPQGRYLFPGLIPSVIILCAGLVLLFRRRSLQAATAVLLGVSMGLFNLYCLYGVIRPHYAQNTFYRQFENAPWDKWDYRIYKWDRNGDLHGRE